MEGIPDDRLMVMSAAGTAPDSAGEGRVEFGIEAGG